MAPRPHREVALADSNTGTTREMAVKKLSSASEVVLTIKRIFVRVSLPKREAVMQKDKCFNN